MNVDFILTYKVSAFATAK